MSVLILVPSNPERENAAILEWSLHLHPTAEMFEVLAHRPSWRKGKGYDGWSSTKISERRQAKRREKEKGTKQLLHCLEVLEEGRVLGLLRDGMPGFVVDPGDLVGVKVAVETNVGLVVSRASMKKV
jgi:hypothetical protein